MDKKSKLILGLAIAFLIVGGIGVFLGAIFKLQHWEGGGIFLVSGMIVEVISGFLFLAVIIRYFFKKDKENEVLSH